MYLAPLLFSCRRDCPTLDETVVTDPNGVTSSDVLEQARTTVLNFADWTGRDSVCVEEVRFVSGLTTQYGEAAGSYDENLIQIDADFFDPDEIILHELCHALDHMEGISWDNRGLFPTGELTVNYPGDERKKTEEVFARACAEGPPSFLRLPSTCPSRPTNLDQTATFLLENVWTNWNGNYEWEPLPYVRRPIDGMPTLTGLQVSLMVPGAGALYIPRAERYEDGSSQLSFSRLDVDSTEVDEIAGPLVADQGHWWLLGGDSDPLLVVIDPEVRAWRIAGDGLRATPFPQSVTWVGEGALSQSAAWLYLTFGAQPLFRRVDLADGSLHSLSKPFGYGGPQYLREGPGGLAAPWYGSSSEQYLVQFDAATESWQSEIWPSDLSPGMAVPVGDGRTIVSWRSLAGDDVFFGLGLVTAEGQWVLDDPCELGQPVGNLMMIDGRPFIVEVALVAGDYAPVALVEIAVP